MRSKIRTAVIVVGGASVIGWSLLRNKSEIHSVQTNVNESQRTPAAVQFKNPVEVTAQKAQETQAAAKAEVKPIEKGQLPQPEVMEKFKVIHAKVFKNDEDQKNLKIMLMDSKYILQLGEYLRDLQSVGKDEFKSNQNAVVDLLIEALKSGDSRSAEQAILDVVKDAQVEDTKLALNTRELLGGVKAELLYQSTSIKPELAEQFSRVLPGPASEKIWLNVQQQQADNLAVSESELQTRQSQKR